MKCFYCGCEESKVVDSRVSSENNSIRRRRECLSCGRRFTTYETMEEAPIYVTKKDGSKQPFISDKLRRSIERACEKRPISVSQIDEIHGYLSAKIFDLPKREVTSTTIGEYVLKELKKYDEVAYIRYASVFYDFDSPADFVNFASKIR